MILCRSVIIQNSNNKVVNRDEVDNSASIKKIIIVLRLYGRSSDCHDPRNQPMERTKRENEIHLILK